MHQSDLMRPKAPLLELASTDAQAAFAVDLDEVLGRVRALLRQKNAAYGDSALDPVLGYLVLLEIAELRKARESQP